MLFCSQSVELWLFWLEYCIQVRKSLLSGENTLKMLRVVFALIIADAVSSFLAPDGSVDMEKIKQSSMNFFYLAIAIGFVSFFQHWCFSMSSQRQMRTLRCQTLQTILRQEIAWFDSQTNAGALASRLVKLCSQVAIKLMRYLEFLEIVSSFKKELAKNWETRSSSSDSLSRVL